MFKVLSKGVGETPKELEGIVRVSPSKIIDFREDPNKLLKKKKRPKSSTMELGKALHMALLEPNKYKENVIWELPDFPRKSKTQPLTVAEQKEAFLAQNRHKIILTESQKTNLDEMILSLENNSLFMKIISGKNLVEKKHWVLIEEKGKKIVFVGIPDVYSEELSLVLDLKSSDSVKKKKWESKVHNYELHIQHASYKFLLQTCYKKEIQHFCWAVCQSSWPWSSRLYYSDFGMLEVGEDLIKKDILSVVECLESGLESDQQTELEQASLPHYAWFNYENELGGQ